MSISDEVLMAFADGELTPDERAAVETAITANPELAERLQAHMRLRERVGAALAGVLTEPVPKRLLAAVEAGERSNILPLRPRAERVPPRWLWASGGAVAAGFALGLIVGGALFPEPDSGMIGADMATRGALARALDSQLVATQGASAVQIKFTFRASDGRLCRVFAVRRADGVAGLACRRPDKSWLVRLAAPMESQGAAGAYQTAASPLPPAVAELAQSLAAGEPFGAAAEAKAKAAGWR